MPNSRQSGPSQAAQSLVNLLLQRHVHAARQTVSQIRDEPLTASLISLVIAVAMALPASLLLISLNLQTHLGKLDETSEITAYFPSDLPKNRISEISEYLHTQFVGIEVRYVSTALALAQLNEVDAFQPILNSLENNPLPAALIVRTDEPSVATARKIEQVLLNLAEVELVELDILWLQKLVAWLRLLDSLTSVLSIIVVGGLLLIIGNTVGSSVQDKREEIRIIKQFGGTDAFVRRPFIHFGLSLGAAGGTLACLLTAGVGHQLGTAAKALALLYQADFVVVGLGFGQNVTIILLSASIGGLAAFFAVSRKIASFGL